MKGYNTKLHSLLKRAYHYWFFCPKDYSDTYFFFNSVITSTMDINKGFDSLLMDDNFSCGIQLMRCQIDNCFALYGYIIADDKDKFIYNYRKNLPLNRIKSNGRELTTRYIKERIDAEYQEYKKLGYLYDECNDWIHPSIYDYYFNRKYESDSSYKCFDNIIIGNQRNINPIDAIMKRTIVDMHIVNDTLYKLFYRAFICSYRGMG